MSDKTGSQASWRDFPAEPGLYVEYEIATRKMSIRETFPMFTPKEVPDYWEKYGTKVSSRDYLWYGPIPEPPTNSGSSHEEPSVL